jgi:predicted negative regulator of RcsB-dependent stress response
MANLESDERNIIEGQELNWRLVAYPIILVVVLALAALGIYHYQLDQHEQAEEKAAAALAAATTPAEIVKVADDYPGTVQSAVGLMRAADLSYVARDYDGAQKQYQRVIESKQAPDELRDSAQLGLASAQEAGGKSDDAIHTYMEVAQKGTGSPFAPVAYHQVAAIYASRQDKAHEEQVLQQALRLGGDSPFVKEAADRLKVLSPDAPAATSTNAAPAP